jgi:hypothetical protein
MFNFIGDNPSKKKVVQSLPCAEHAENGGERFEQGP